MEAIYEGCLIRFRPIMMTTVAALLGSLPIALGYGAGGEARRPLGLTVVGGLAVSQFMTLVSDSGGLHLYGVHPRAGGAAGIDRCPKPSQATRSRIRAVRITRP